MDNFKLKKHVPNEVQCTFFELAYEIWAFDNRNIVKIHNMVVERNSPKNISYLCLEKKEENPLDDPMTY